MHFTGVKALDFLKLIETAIDWKKIPVVPFVHMSVR
jgi:hypothetical protein